MRGRIKTILLVVTLLLLPHTALADRDGKGSSKEELFSLANLAFADGRYEEAASTYVAIIEKGMDNPDVYFNLGNAYARADQKGRAIFAYEKSLELQPLSDDAEYNMALLLDESSTEGKKVETRAPWEALAAGFTFKSGADLALFLYVLFFAALTALVVSQSEAFRKKARMASTILGVLALLALSFASFKLYLQERDNEGIVLVSDASLFEVPMEQGGSNVAVPEGYRVRISDDNSEWIKVTLPDGSVGWLKREQVGII